MSEPYDLRKDLYEADLAVLDRYQRFSAELLRLSLLALTALGYAFANKILPSRPGLVRLAWAVAIGGFAAAGVLALRHRYDSTDALACHVKFLRLLGGTDVQAQERERRSRNDRLQRCDLLLRSAAWTFGIGLAGFLVLFLTAVL